MQVNDPPKDVSLGSTVVDEITGFSGVVTGRAVYLHGVPMVLVQPRIVTNGIPADSTWLPESRLSADKKEDASRYIL